MIAWKQINERSPNIFAKSKWVQMEKIYKMHINFPEIRNVKRDMVSVSELKFSDQTCTSIYQMAINIVDFSFSKCREYEGILHLKILKIHQKDTKMG